jgi:hypothetical protein
VLILLELTVAWIVVFAYIYIGGETMRDLELPSEKASSREYCEKIDTLINSLESTQRGRFSKLLDTMVGAGMCNAPLCTMASLPQLPVAYKLELENMTCAQFRNSQSEQEFVAQLQSTFLSISESSCVIDITGCSEVSTRQLVDDGRGRRTSATPVRILSVDTILKSASIENFRSTQQACGEAGGDGRDSGEKSFHEAFDSSGSFGALEAGGNSADTSLKVLSFSCKEEVIPEGTPMMVIDANDIGSYPASMFADPSKKEGEPLDGFAALDPLTGKISAIAAPARSASSSTTAKTAIAVAPPPVCAERRRLEGGSGQRAEERHEPEQNMKQERALQEDDDPAYRRKLDAPTDAPTVFPTFVEGYRGLWLDNQKRVANDLGCNAGGWSTGKTMVECAAECEGRGELGKVCYNFAWNSGTGGCYNFGGCATSASPSYYNTDGWQTFYRNANNGGNCPNPCTAVDVNAVTVEFNILNAGDPDRYKFSQGGAGDGWDLIDSFFAYTSQAAGTVQFDILDAGDPHRYKLSTPGALDGWVLQDSFWAFASDPGDGAVQFHILDAGDPHRYKVNREGAGEGWAEVSSFWAYTSGTPTDTPTAAPTDAPTAAPPTDAPTAAPTDAPTTATHDTMLVVDGRKCVGGTTGWKGSGTTIDACRAAVLADWGCAHNFFEFTNTDSNCMCASLAAESTDCSQGSNQQDESVMQIYQINNAPYELVATGQRCGSTTNAWKGSGCTLESCRLAVLGDSGCAHDFFEFAWTDQNCRCASSPAENHDCSQASNRMGDPNVNIYRIETTRAPTAAPTAAPIATPTATPAVTGCTWMQGNGNGTFNSELHIGTANSNSDCYAMVLAQQPTANGVTVYYNDVLEQYICFAEFGMSGTDQTWPAIAEYQTCQFSPSDTALPVVSGSMSSEFAGQGAAICFDGVVADINGVVDGVCHTEHESTPWLQLDLGASFTVTMVRIYNRQDCCQDRLGAHQVWLSESPTEPATKCFDGTAAATNGPFDEACNGAGRYVRILVQVRERSRRCQL